MNTHRHRATQTHSTYTYSEQYMKARAHARMHSRNNNNINKKSPYTWSHRARRMQREQVHSSSSLFVCHCGRLQRCGAAHSIGCPPVRFGHWMVCAGWSWCISGICTARCSRCDWLDSVNEQTEDHCVVPTCLSRCTSKWAFDAYCSLSLEWHGQHTHTHIYTFTLKYVFVQCLFASWPFWIALSGTMQ